MEQESLCFLTWDLMWLSGKQKLPMVPYWNWTSLRCLSAFIFSVVCALLAFFVRKANILDYFLELLVQCCNQRLTTNVGGMEDGNHMELCRYQLMIFVWKSECGYREVSFRKFHLAKMPQSLVFADLYHAVLFYFIFASGLIPKICGSFPPMASLRCTSSHPKMRQ